MFGKFGSQLLDNMVIGNPCPHCLFFAVAVKGKLSDQGWYEVQGKEEEGFLGQHARHHSLFSFQLVLFYTVLYGFFCLVIDIMTISNMFLNCYTYC